MYLRPFGQGPKPARAAPALHRHASPAQIRRRRSMACSSVAPRKRSAPGGLPPPPLDPCRSALASRRARRHASAAPQVQARRPQSSRPAAAGLPAAHHRRRSTVSALPRGARAAPPWLRVLRSLSVSVLGVSCLRPAALQWAGSWSGWAWRKGKAALTGGSEGALVWSWRGYPPSEAKAL